MSAPRLAIRYVLAVVIGIVLLVVVFRWVLIDSYQSADLPTTPLAVRTAIVLALYALVAGLLSYVSRDAIRDETLMLGLLAAACAGSWLGSRLPKFR